MVLYILFWWSGTPACSQQVFCKLFCIWRCIPDYPWREMYSMSTYTSTILFSSLVCFLYLWVCFCFACTFICIVKWYFSNLSQIKSLVCCKPSNGFLSHSQSNPNSKQRPSRSRMIWPPWLLGLRLPQLSPPSWLSPLIPYSCASQGPTSGPLQLLLRLPRTPFPKAGL